MKKFLKAVALATVMCMLLSVSAFAAVTPNADTDEITLSVQAGANEQVAVLVVTTGANLANLTDAQIEYIGQETANGEGLANFGTFKVKNADAKVDIWVGSTTLSADGAAQKLNTEAIDLEGVKKITIVTGENAKIQANQIPGEGGVKYGYAAAITVNVPEDLDPITKMVWAFKVNNAWVYSKSVANPVGEDASSVVTGSTQFAAAFDAYTVAADGATAPIDVTDVAAIFLTGTDETDTDNMHYTDDTLKKYGE